MRELVDDIFYQEYSIFIDSVIDYCIIKDDECNSNLDRHKRIVLFAMDKWNQRMIEIGGEPFNYVEDKMIAKKITVSDFFNEEYQRMFLHPPIMVPNRRKYIASDNLHNDGDTIIYKQYTLKDFNYLNGLLFPNGLSNLEIYEWNTCWSNYFDDGLEWWGAKCVSIYDRASSRYVVIGVSATD